MASTATPESNSNVISNSNPSPKHEWLVIVPDRPGVLAQRMKVREYVGVFSLFSSFIALCSFLSSRSRCLALFSFHYEV